MHVAHEEQRAAFEAEMLPQLDAAYRLARTLTGHDQDAEDLVQEAYLRAFAGFQGYRRNSNARAWLLTIVRRTFFNDRRRARARPLLFPLAGPEEPDEPADTRSPGTEEQALRAIDSRIILSALDALPEPARSAVTLVDLEGMHYAEAAAILDCPVGTVMSRLHRGRLELARRLQRLLTGTEAS